MSAMPFQAAEVLQNLPEWLRSGSNYDLLKWMRQPELGINKPQMYMTVPGCWNGGTEQSLRITLIDCNHGPGSIEWCSIAKEHVPKLRQLVLTEFSVDIYSSEGDW
eukprot:6274-Heterococcus_DN1.PRE.1